MINWLKRVFRKKVIPCSCVNPGDVCRFYPRTMSDTCCFNTGGPIRWLDDEGQWTEKIIISYDDNTKTLLVK